MKDFMKSNRKKRNVLVVDDEMINRELLDAVLSSNYDITTACNGEEALMMLRNADEPYSLILLDLMMPRMTGFEVITACKKDEQLKDIPIIVMTSEKSAEVRSIRLGAADFITKPYRMPEVIITRCERIIELSEEQALVRSIERDPSSGLYIEVIFKAYVRRLLPDAKNQRDAIVLTIDGLDALDGAAKDRMFCETARLTDEILVENKGIACRSLGNDIFVYRVHNDSYAALTGRMKDAFSALPGAGGLTLRIGVCENVSAAASVDSWFDDAAARCN